MKRLSLHKRIDKLKQSSGLRFAGEKLGVARDGFLRFVSPGNNNPKIVKRVISEIYKGQDPASALTYVPRVNLRDLLNNPKAYIKRKRRIVETIVKSRAKEAVLRVADEIINGPQDHRKLKTRYDLYERNNNMMKLLEANTPIHLSQERGLDGESYIRHFIELYVKDGDEEIKFFDGHAIIKLSEQKNILLTKVQGRDLTRKEYISGGDYNITITGKVVSPYQDVYPTNEVMNLRKILKYKGVVTCRSPFLDIFEISSILILSYDIPQNIGFSNVQNYSFQAVFEKPIEALKHEENEKRKILSAKQMMQEEIAKREAWIEANPEKAVSKVTLKDFLRKFSPKQFIQLQNWI